MKIQLIFVTLLGIFTIIFAEANIREILFKNGPCLRSQFRCLNDNCIPRNKFCNSLDDCGDNSDEKYCNEERYSCPNYGQYFSCRLSKDTNYYESCIPVTWKCDGIHDCYNAEDERNCQDDIALPLQITSFQINRSMGKARKWIFEQRKAERSTQKWGPSIARKAVALYLSDNTIFEIGNNFTHEIAYELSLDFLSQIALKKIEDVSTFELASYLNAFLVFCIDPRKFYMLDLVKELRNRVDSTNNANPFAILSLCNAKDTITNGDTQKLYDAFYKAQREFRTDTQALAVLALSCATNQPDSSIDHNKLSELTMELKQKQFRNGTVENFKTTALIMQALFASETSPDEDNFDERKAIYQIIRSQETDGSFGSITNTYYAIPVLAYSSLINISAEHCPKTPKDEIEGLEYLKKQVGLKWNITYSLWIGDDKSLQRTMTLGIPANISFYSIMEYAADLDTKYKFQYNVRNNKPYIFALYGLVDDAESEMFWTPYYFVNQSKHELKPITESPAVVIPENNDHLVFWYKKGS